MSTSQADLVLRNGRIYTVNGNGDWAEAMAVKDGKIVAIGSESVISGYTEGAEVIDLDGKMVMPGIVDVHNHHFIAGASDLFELRFLPSLSYEEVLEKVRERAAQTEPGGWIIGGSWGSNFADRLNSLEAKKALDDAAGGRPVLLRDDTYHNRWVNTAALAAAGITRDTADPEQGEILRDPETGEATGVLLETAAAFVERAADEAQPLTPEQQREAASSAMATLNSFGVTAFLDAACMEYMMAALKGLDDRDEMTCWAGACLPATEPGFIFGKVGKELIAVKEQYRGKHVFPDFIKIFLDGVPPARTAAFVEPYVPDTIHGCCFCGATKMTVPELVRWVGDAEKEGMGVKIHCAGDAAVLQALDAFEVVRSFNGPTEIKHHVAHASFIREEDIMRFAELGVVADLCPIIWYPTPILEATKAALGEERAERFWPNKKLDEAGALMASGSDWPVAPQPDPWDGIEGMITRENPSGAYPGQSLWKEQALGLEKVLEIYTINAAKAMRIDEFTGSLESGKFADFIVLDRNLFETPEKDLADTRVLKTFFKGRKVFERT
ncbi:amidohydrolase [Cucumibacter marinus]|uniref:amidohydrolase n=1 Tax=Cucumibacter marinus TaxID=1121252 RepID=UPI00048C8FDB|nr:amidohydrolase [Cucumibacter marinus]